MMWKVRRAMIESISDKRWFMGKGRKVHSIEEYDSFPSGGTKVSIVEVRFEKGECDYYAVIEDESKMGAVLAEYFGQKVSSKLLAAIVEVAKGRNQTLRLVSSAMNLDSFSLYNRAGFIPTEMYQDMQIRVPDEGFELAQPSGATLRDAVESDVAAIVELERRLRGIDRAKDYKFFIENASGIWGVSVLVDDATGALRGVMCSVRDPGCAMVGPGVAVDEESAIALVTRELNRYAGEWSPIVLVPTNAPILRLQMYAYGGRNTETHVAQSLGEALVASGVAIPTFMPETA